MPDQPAPDAPRRDHPILFANVESTGSFIRDTVIGGCLHRGVSYRELQEIGAVHLCVDGNRVTAHVDRYSPLNHRGRGRFRYSLAGVLAHWLEDVVKRCARRVLGRAGGDRCRLSCEVVWVPDDEVDDDRGRLELECRVVGDEHDCDAA